MIYIKDGTLERTNNWQKDTICIVTDFDRTITSGNSDGSWGVLSKCPFIPKEYDNDRRKLYEFYRPIELDNTLDYDYRCMQMINWWQNHINLLIKYQISENDVNKAANNHNLMIFRDGADLFLEKLAKNYIPVIMISAGFGNFIKQFLITKNCDYDNIDIISNFINFENGIANGLKAKIIHSLNKNEVMLSEKLKNVFNQRHNILLLGDNLGDVNMISDEQKNNALKIGFLEEKVEENLEIYKENFDIVCTDNYSLQELMNSLTFLN